jgi:hypothetical protein
MSLDLIGEFTGKNTVTRVLPDGKIEVSNQGMGQILGIDAFLMSTAVGTMANGIFTGEVNTLLTTMDGATMNIKSNAVSWQDTQGKGGITRAGSIQMTQSQKLIQLNTVILLHEYVTNELGDWTGKIWVWK